MNSNNNNVVRLDGGHPGAAAAGQLFDTTEEILLKLLAYGKPNLWCHGPGAWSANIEVNTNVNGADFKIRTTHDFATPHLAAVALAEMVAAAINIVK